MSRTRTNCRRQAGLVTDLTLSVGLPLGMLNPKTSHTCHTQCLANTLMRCICHSPNLNAGQFKTGLGSI